MQVAICSFCLITWFMNEFVIFSMICIWRYDDLCSLTSGYPSSSISYHCHSFYLQQPRTTPPPRHLSLVIHSWPQWTYSSSLWWISIYPALHHPWRMDNQPATVYPILPVATTVPATTASVVSHQNILAVHPCEHPCTCNEYVSSFLE